MMDTIALVPDQLIVRAEHDPRDYHFVGGLPDSNDRPSRWDIYGNIPNPRAGPDYPILRAAYLAPDVRLEPPMKRTQSGAHRRLEWST